MKKYGKAGLLIFTLVMPALVFVFLNYFGSNHYTLPYFNPERDVNGSIVIQNGDTVFAKTEHIRLSELGDSLQSTPELIGNFTVVNYFQRGVPDSTKMVLAQLERINALKRNINQVQVVSIGDSADIRNWQRGKQEGWLFVTGNSATIEHVVKVELGLYSNRKEVPIFAKFQLIDDKGYSRGYYNATEPDEVERLMAEIKILNYERGKSLEK